MHARRGIIVLGVVALMTSVLFVAPAAGDSHSGCDPDYVSVDGYEITVAPTGGDDTANLQCALDLATAMSYARVLLVDGDYYTDFLETEGFHGLFRGEGREATTLNTLPGGLDCIARLGESNDLHLLSFAASDVVVKGLAFGTGGDAACAEPWNVVDNDGQTINFLAISALTGTTRLRVADACPDVVEHRLQVYGIAVTGEFPDFTTPVVDINKYLVGVRSGPPRFDRDIDCHSQLQGTTIVRGSQFTDLELGIVLAGHKDSHDYVGGHYPSQGNEISGVNVGVLFEFSSGGKFVAANNHMREVHDFGVLAFGDPGESPTTAKIVRNHIRGIANADGIGAIDIGPFAGGPMLDTKIGWNKIDMHNTPFNGIVAVGTDGRILRNRVTGSAVSGIALEPLGFFDPEAEEFVVVAESTGWHIASNWFPQFGGQEADIVLRPGTADNTVECAWWGHEVLDMGINNTLIGCGEPGEPGEPSATTQAAGFDHAGLDKALRARARYGR